MPEQKRPLVTLKEPDGSQHKIWLDKETIRGDIELTMNPDSYLAEVTQIITKRLVQAYGVAPDNEIEASVATFAYNPKRQKISVSPDKMCEEAKNVLEELERRCDGAKSVGMVLEEYNKHMDKGGVGADRDREGDKVLALKPILHQEELEAVLETIFSRIPDHILSEGQKNEIGQNLIHGLSNFPRPEVIGSTALEKAANMGTEKDVLYVAIQTAVIQAMQKTEETILPGSGLILEQKSTVTYGQTFIIGEIYDAVQNAYKERAGEMTP